MGRQGCLKGVPNKLRILLVQPAVLGPENVLWLSEPVALTSLAAMVSEHDVRILDLRLEPDTELNRTLAEFRPDIVGTWSMTTGCRQAKAVLKVAKSALGKDCFTIVGGDHPTVAPEDFDDEMIDAIVMGEGEIIFQEIVSHLAAGGSAQELHHINGLLFRDDSGDFTVTPKRGQRNSLDDFPIPARHLIPERYRKEYFFTFLSGMASMETSRGCSFDGTLCAIQELSERRTHYMSASAICDRLEQMTEKCVFFLDDNFLTNHLRLEELCDEIARRGIRKYYGAKGRSDFIADNPELMRRLRDCGFIAVLSDYERGAPNTNVRAAQVLGKLGIIAVGVFTARADFEEKDFDLLYQTINEMKIALPLVTIQTPLAGTEPHLPTNLSRERFHQKFAEWHRATRGSTIRGLLSVVWRRPDFFFFHALRQSIRFLRSKLHHFTVMESNESHLSNETCERQGIPCRAAH